MRHALDFRNRGDAGEFVVGFVHHDDGLLRARQDALDGEQAQSGTGGVIGIGEDDGAGLGRDGVEDFLKGTKNPAYGGEVTYGDRAEHCWNGDPTRPNAYSRLRYHQMFIPKIAERIRKTAPPGSDLTSWRY